MLETKEERERQYRERLLRLDRLIKQAKMLDVIVENSHRDSVIRLSSLVKSLRGKS